MKIENGGKEKILRVGNIETRRAILAVNGLISVFVLLMKKD